MDISIDLVKANLKKLGTTGTYPHTDNCYRVEVSTPGQEPFVAEYFPKAKFYLVSSLQDMRLSGVLPETDLQALIQRINAYGEEKYDQAADDAAMNAAGEHL